MPIVNGTYGYKLITAPTDGSLFWDAIEFNFSRLDTHNHDGTTGAPIASSTGTASSGAWGSDLGGGRYRQEITMPAGRTFDTTRFEVRDSNNEVTYNTLVKTASNKFYIYTNDNSKTYTIHYV